MAASFFVNTLQVEFESVLTMEHTGMAWMFKSLVDIGIEGFLAASGSVYENAVVELFANVKVVTGTIISTVANEKLALTKEVFAEAFKLPTEGMTRFLDIPNPIVVEMCGRFFGSDVPFMAPRKKKEMKVEFRLLHDIMAKAVCAKTRSFDVVISEKFDLMLAISAGLKVNWVQILFQVLVAMVNNPTRQSQGFVFQQSVLLDRLVKADHGEVVKLHHQKLLASKSVQTYIKKNFGVVPACETSKVSEVSPVSINQLPKVFRLTELRRKPVKRRIWRKRLTRGFVHTESIEEPWRQAQKSGRVSDSEATVTVPLMLITKKHRTKREKKVPTTANPQVEYQNGTIPEIPAGGDKGSTSGGPETTMETPPDLENQAGDGSNTPEHIEHMECWNVTSNVDEQEDLMEYETQTEKESQDGTVSTIAQGELDKSTDDGPEGLVENEGRIENVEQIERVASSNQPEMEDATDEGTNVVRSGPEKPTQKSMKFTGKGIFAPMEIRDINWATHFMPEIEPTAKGKGMSKFIAQPNPMEEHCQLVLRTAWEDVSSKITDYDEWMHFRTVVRLKNFSSFEDLTKIEERFLFWAETEQVSELFEHRLLILYKLYEMELQNRVDEHRANFKPAEPYLMYEYMCIRFLSRELKEIQRQHRTLCTLAGLPLLALEASIAEDAANVVLPQVTWCQACKYLLTGDNPA
ncbi:hypothetical protein F511_12640 [Dorcoceras hygrometricum]|uniref:Splicing factor 3B subunit 1-like n=1 Tax=Dorcoceras hygrometricum TaxID=472368 RepID=A0A2Z7CHH7_9LAMI|nr:hypothetical protein F511_12640 [Dorcoceras hygrometricum]